MLSRTVSRGPPGARIPTLAERMVHGLLKAAVESMVSSRVAIAAACVVALLTVGGPLRAEPVPEATTLPERLSLEQSIQILRTRGLNVLLAEAQVESAEGDVGVAGAVPNPAITVGYGRVLPPYQCQPGDGCSANQYTVGLSDQAALEDSLSGKRSLRMKVARAALAATKLSRVDALRTLEYQVKSAYVQLAQAQRAVALARENQATNVRTLQLFQARLRSGAINEGDVARIETQKLESDQSVDQAVQNVRQARITVAFLLGARGPVPEYAVDDSVLDFAVPASLATVTTDRMLRMAFEHRSDLIAQGYQRASAEAAVELARRQRFPDITISAQYTQTGSGQAAIQPPTLSVGLTAPIPLFYQQQGEIRRAQAGYDTQSLQQAKATAQVVGDVSAAMANFETSRALIERMEGALRPSAERAFQITRLQYDRGGAALIDFLDAQRTHIAINVEYLQDLANYWIAVFQLEQAVGMELYR
jgi:cobalt-zinc-cadmium efflux system outer membrane protein